MAKSSRKTKTPGPPRDVTLVLTDESNDIVPIVNVAAFCEKILTDKDNVLSAIRFVDILTVIAPANLPKMVHQGQEVPSPSTVPISLVLILRSGGARGERTLRVDAVFPSGKKEKGKENIVNFVGGDSGGINIQGTAMVHIEEEGVYWYELKINNKLLTRMPLQIVYANSNSEQHSEEQEQPKKKKD